MKFYDHTMNQTNPAIASAMARSRRESLEAGEAWMVVGQWPHQATPFYWDGLRFDAVQLAKQLLANGAEVALFDPSGAKKDIRRLRY